MKIEKGVERGHLVRRSSEAMNDSHAEEVNFKEMWRVRSLLRSNGSGQDVRAPSCNQII